MSEIFISHVEEDGANAIDFADKLTRAGYGTWYYERDATAGMSYLRQVTAAIEQCQVFVLIISRASLASIQMDRELTHAFEKQKSLLPLLKGLSFDDFQLQKPDWKFALGPSVARALPSATADDVIRALGAMGLQPRHATTSSRSADEIVVRLRIAPEDIVRELLPLLRSADLHCSYRVTDGSELGAPCSAQVVAITGGLFVVLRQISRNAFVQLRISHHDRSWESAFLAVDCVETPLYRNSD